MNQLLRLKIVEKFETNQAFSDASGIDKSTITRIIHGDRIPTEEQKKLIAKLLRMKKDYLFPPDDVAPSIKIMVNEPKVANGKG